MDFYKELSSKILNKPYEQITDEERRKIKSKFLFFAYTFNTIEQNKILNTEIVNKVYNDYLLELGEENEGKNNF